MTHCCLLPHVLLWEIWSVWICWLFSMWMKYVSPFCVQPTQFTENRDEHLSFTGTRKVVTRLPLWQVHKKKIAFPRQSFVHMLRTLSHNSSGKQEGITEQIGDVLTQNSSNLIMQWQMTLKQVGDSLDHRTKKKRQLRTITIQKFWTRGTKEATFRHSTCRTLPSRLRRRWCVAEMDAWELWKKREDDACAVDHTDLSVDMKSFPWLANTESRKAFLLSST